MGSFEAVVPWWKMCVGCVLHVHVLYTLGTHLLFRVHFGNHPEHDGVTQVRVKSWHQCHYVLKRERGIELLKEFAHRCQELNMGKMIVYSMSLNTGLNLQ